MVSVFFVGEGSVPGSGDFGKVQGTRGMAGEGKLKHVGSGFSEVTTQGMGW